MSVDLNNTPNPQGQTTPPGQGANQNNTPSGQTPNLQQQTPPQGQGQQQHSPLTEHWTDSDREYIKRLRDEAKSANDALAAIKQKEADEQQERLKQQGKFEDLAKKHEARVKELEPVALRYKDLTEQINGQIDADIKDWPKSVKALDPGRDAPVETRLAWRTSASAIISEMATQAQSGRPGNSPNPPATGQQGQNQQQNIDELRRRSQERYGRIF